MANKTTRKKFRPPLKTPNSSQPYSLLCSQTSTATSGASGVGESQDRGKESSQSWLSQLTTAESTCTGAKNPLVTATTPALITATDILDDSLCNEVDHHKQDGVVANESYFTEANKETARATVTDYDGLPQKKSAVTIQADTFNIFDFPDSGTSTPDCSLLNSTKPGCFSTAKSRPVNHLEVISTTRLETEELLANLLSQDSEEEGEMEREMVSKNPPSQSRFKRKGKSTARGYDYCSILPKIGAQRSAMKKKTNNGAKAKRKKNVSLLLNQSKISSVVRFEGSTDVERDTTECNIGDLSVYDYQLTPQQQEEEEGEGRALGGEREDSLSELNSSNWITKRTREEQLAVDREVLQTIAKIRDEIRILRETYKARKAKKLKATTGLPTTTPLKTASTTFKVPKKAVRRSQRGSAKPSLVIMQGYGGGSARKVPYGVTQESRHRYAVLEKEE